MLTLPGADAVLAVHGGALPQPDQLCGPFSARQALHAVLDAASVPGVVELARAAGSAVHEGEHPGERPAGTSSDRRPWSDLPRVDDPARSGTDATGLARAVEDACPEVAVVPVSAAKGPPAATSVVRLLGRLAGRTRPVGVLANVRTAPIAPAGETWDVGHFVVLLGVTEDGEVALADTYAALTAPGWPPGCRPVPAAALAEALADRGLLLLCAALERPTVEHLVGSAGLRTTLWAT